MKRNALVVGDANQCVFFALFSSSFLLYLITFEPLWHAALLQGFGYPMYMISSSMEIADLFLSVSANYSLMKLDEIVMRTYAHLCVYL